jgi:hypothetical protein
MTWLKSVLCATHVCISGVHGSRSNVLPTLATRAAQSHMCCTHTSAAHSSSLHAIITRDSPKSSSCHALITPTFSSTNSMPCQARVVTVVSALQTQASASSTVPTLVGLHHRVALVEVAEVARVPRAALSLLSCRVAGGLRTACEFACVKDSAYMLGV